MTLEQLVSICKANGVHRIKSGTLELEFFPNQPTPMDLSPKALASAMADSMPPDSAMMFASAEGVPEEEEVTQ